MRILIAIAALAVVLAAIATWGRWMRRTRTSVTVFVDDAVRGRFPPVCAITGRPADAVVRLEQPMRSFEPLWLLLLLLGPWGMIALAIVLVANPGGGTVTAAVPFADTSIERFRAGVRQRRIGAVVSVAGLLAALASQSGALGAIVDEAALMAALAAVVGGALIAVDGHNQVLSSSIRITLDGSRRWVTLRGVHPELAAAVEDRHEFVRSTN